jgi:hypothetical protein
MMCPNPAGLYWSVSLEHFTEWLTPVTTAVLQGGKGWDG